MFGVSIGPPYEAIAENPTSSSTAYTTFGAPSGAFGGSNGDQSGTESRISTLTLPLNGSLITHSSLISFEIGRHDQGAQRRTRGAVVPTLLQTAAPAHHPHRTIVRTSAGEPSSVARSKRAGSRGSGMRRPAGRRWS